MKCQAPASIQGVVSMLGRIPKEADLDKTKRMINLLLGDLEMLFAQRTDRISKVERVAASRQAATQEYDDAELRREMGILGDAVAEESRTRSEADSELQTQIEALQGAIIYLGHTTYATAQVTANTALLTQWCQSNNFYPLKHGYCVVDNDANDWVWNSEKNLWINIGYYDVATATNVSKGVVSGNDVDLGVVVDANGKMSVKNLSTVLGGKAPANASLSATTNADTTTTTGDVPSNTVQGILQTIWAKIRSVANALGNKVDSYKDVGNIDVNTLLTTGIYRVFPGPNTPTNQVNRWTIAVFNAGSDNSVIQIAKYYSTTDPYVYIRGYNYGNQTWGQWINLSIMLNVTDAAVGSDRPNTSAYGDKLVQRSDKGYVYGRIFNMAYPRQDDLVPSDMIYMYNEDGFIRQMSFDLMRRKLLAANPAWVSGLQINGNDEQVDLNSSYFTNNQVYGWLKLSSSCSPTSQEMWATVFNIRHRLGTGDGVSYGEQIVFGSRNGGQLGNAWIRGQTTAGWSGWVKIAIPYNDNLPERYVIRGDGSRGYLSDMEVDGDDNTVPPFPGNIPLAGFTIAYWLSWIRRSFSKFFIMSDYTTWASFNHTSLNNNVSVAQNVGSRYNPSLDRVEIFLDIIINGNLGSDTSLVSNSIVPGPSNELNFALYNVTSHTSDLFRIQKSGAGHFIKPIYGGLYAGSRYIGYLNYFTSL